MQAWPRSVEDPFGFSQCAYSRRVPLTPNFFGFREKVKNPPVKQFDPQRINGRKVPLGNGAGPPSDDSGDGERKKPKKKKGKSFKKHAR